MAWREIFGASRAVPEEVGTACCAQFAVTGARIRRRPRSDYVGFRRWLLKTPLEDGVSGRVFEYLWHIIFADQEVLCPEPWRCRCELYGRGCGRSPRPLRG